MSLTIGLVLLLQALSTQSTLLRGNLQMKLEGNAGELLHQELSAADDLGLAYKCVDTKTTCSVLCTPEASESLQKILEDMKAGKCDAFKELKPEKKCKEFCDQISTELKTVKGLECISAP
ncbi:MAG: hypothetical protein MHMPM18_001728 [Marteilia pararefringens]